MATEQEAQLLLSAYRAGMTSQKELANFMAQVSIESGGLNRLNEGFIYSKGIKQIVVDANVKSAMREGPGVLEAARLEAIRGEPERLAELMYGGRMGNSEPGDGYKYHGRGYIQLTGKNQYRAAGEALGLDLVDRPELAAQPEHAAKIAVLYWKTNVLNEDRENVVRAGGQINTGDPNLTATHADRRQAKYEEWKKTLTPEIMEKLSRGEVALPIATGAQSTGDSTVQSLQRNLNALNIRDAHDRPLETDGARGGPNSRTNEAIAAFQRQVGLIGQISDADLLAATQVALNTRQAFDFDRTLRGVLPENAQPPRRTDDASEALMPRHPAPPPPRITPAPQATDPIRLPPMPPVAELHPGARGAAVFALQEHLRLLNARDGEGNAIRADRDYGERTRTAVENFQLWAGLDTTGVADRATLDALQEHAAYALQQRTQGLAPDAHLADHLKPAAWQPQIAAERSPVQGRQTTQTPPSDDDTPARLPYGHPHHPEHATFVELKQKLAAHGHAEHLSDARLHQAMAAMQTMRLDTTQRWDARAYPDKIVMAAEHPAGARYAWVDLAQPEPTVEQAMRQVEAFEQRLAQAMEPPARGPDVLGHAR